MHLHHLFTHVDDIGFLSCHIIVEIQVLIKQRLLVQESLENLRIDRVLNVHQFRYCDNFIRLPLNTLIYQLLTQTFDLHRHAFPCLLVQLRIYCPALVRHSKDFRRTFGDATKLVLHAFGQYFEKVYFQAFLSLLTFHVASFKLFELLNHILGLELQSI